MHLSFTASLTTMIDFDPACITLASMLLVLWSLLVPITTMPSLDSLSLVFNECLMRFMMLLMALMTLSRLNLLSRKRRKRVRFTSLWLWKGMILLIARSSSKESTCMICNEIKRLLPCNQMLLSTIYIEHVSLYSSGGVGWMYQRSGFTRCLHYLLLSAWIAQGARIVLFLFTLCLYVAYTDTPWYLIRVSGNRILLFLKEN